MILTPKLSVIIPVYNGEAYIDRCLNSILNQSLKEIQIILIDDASTDETLTRVSAFAEKHSNLLVIPQPKNRGTGVCRNIGLEAAAGEFVAFLDADDWVDTNTYLEMTSAMQRTGAEIAVCGIRTEYGTPFLSKPRYQYPYENLISGSFALKLLSRTDMQDAFISPMPGNKMFRAEFLKHNGLSFPERSLYEDDEFMFFAFGKAGHVVLVPDVYQHYFQRAGSACHTFSNHHIKAFLTAFEHIKQRLEQEHTFDLYEKEYFAFLDKGMASLLDTLFSCEQDVAAQRKYLSALLDGLLKLFSIQTLMEHIEPKRLSRIWE